MLGIPDSVTQADLVPVAYDTGTTFKPASPLAGGTGRRLERLVHGGPTRATSCGSESDVELINPPGVMTPIGGYSQGTALGGWVFVAGQTGVDENGRPTGSGGIEDQTRQAIANIATVLAAAGASLHDVVTTTVFLADFEHYADFNRVYSEGFGAHKPARATVRAELVHPSLLVEMQAIALKTPQPETEARP